MKKKKFDVLILIILEVLYEYAAKMSREERVNEVLILIILEVLYEIIF